MNERSIEAVSKQDEPKQTSEDWGSNMLVQVTKSEEDIFFEGTTAHKRLSE
jgi:hypothetical protein